MHCKTKHVKEYLLCPVDFCNTLAAVKTAYDPQVTLRLAPDIKKAALELAEKRGVKNLSDFIRQAVVAELKRAEAEAALEAHRMQLARQHLEAQAAGEKVVPFDFGLPAKKKSETQSGQSRSTPPIPSPKSTG